MSISVYIHLSLHTTRTISIFLVTHSPHSEVASVDLVPVGDATAAPQTAVAPQTTAVAPQTGVAPQTTAVAPQTAIAPQTGDYCRCSSDYCRCSSDW